MKLFIVRHGQTDWNIQNRIQGHTNVPLNDLGRWQSEKIIEELAHEKIQKIFTSDLLRCKITADALSKATEAELEVTPFLRERHFGIWEGKLASEVPFPLTTLDGMGEVLDDVWKRIDEIYQQIIISDQNTAVITHGGTCMMFLAKIIKGSIETAASFHFQNASITELHKERRGDHDCFRLFRLSDTSHLKEDIIDEQALVLT